MRKKNEKKFNEEETRRIGMVLKCEVNTKNKIAAIGVLPVPAIRCMIGILNWSLDEISRIEGKIKRDADSVQNHHVNVDIEGLLTYLLHGAESFLRS